MAMTARLSVALSLSLSVMPPSTATGTDVEPLMVNSGFRRWASPRAHRAG